MNVNVIPIVTILSSTGVTVVLLLFVSFYYCMKKVSCKHLIGDGDIGDKFIRVTELWR